MKKPNLKPSPTLSYILGVLLGDGCCYANPKRREYRVQLISKDEKFAKSFYKALTEIGLNPHIRYVTTGINRNTYFLVRAQSKVLVGWFKQLTQNDIYELASKYPIDFIRGFYESEGSLIKRTWGGGYDLEICNTEKWIVDMVVELLQKLGFNPRIKKCIPSSKSILQKKPTYYIRLRRQDEIAKFMRIVSPCIKNNIDKNCIGALKRFKHPPEVIRKAFEFKKCGYGYKRIGKMLGISPWTVRDWFRNKNIEEVIEDGRN
ncbi:hypothetical protein J7M00_05750 [bacterium]|nr:hypothetical protein [bacterium]